MKNIIRKIRQYQDVFSGSILLLVCIILYTQTYEIKMFSSLSDSVGPRFFPRVVLVVLSIMALLLIIIGIRKGRHAAPIAGDDTHKAGSHEGKLFTRFIHLIEANERARTWVSILGIFFFILLMKPLGFAISGTIYLFVQFSLLAPREKRKLWLYAVIAVVVAFGAYFVFRYAININLTAGLLQYIL